MKTYLVVGFWPFTEQRFAECVTAKTPASAETKIAKKYPGVALCGTLQGDFDAVDTKTQVTYT